MDEDEDTLLQRDPTSNIKKASDQNTTVSVQLPPPLSNEEIIIGTIMSTEEIVEDEV